MKKPQDATRVGQKSDSLLELATGSGLMIRAASTRAFVTDPALPVCSFCILPAFKIQISDNFKRFYDDFAETNDNFSERYFREKSEIFA